MWLAANDLTDVGAATCDSRTGHTSRPECRMHTKGVSTVSEKENKELVEKGYAAFAAGDVQAVMDLFDDDIEWTQPGQSAISGTFHGKAEVMEFLGRLAEKTPTVTVKRLIAEGDTVAAITEVTVDGESSEDVDVMTIRNGKTIRMQVHGDTALLERVYGKKQLAAG
jgi:ketosteroid isomerase-like protein